MVALNLWGNKLQDAEKVMQEIRKCPKLKALWLNENPVLGKGSELNLSFSSVACSTKFFCAYIHGNSMAKQNTNWGKTVNIVIYTDESWEVICLHANSRPQILCFVVVQMIDLNMDAFQLPKAGLEQKTSQPACRFFFSMQSSVWQKIGLGCVCTRANKCIHEIWGTHMYFTFTSITNGYYFTIG